MQPGSRGFLSGVVHGEIDHGSFTFSSGGLSFFLSFPFFFSYLPFSLIFLSSLLSFRQDPKLTHDLFPIQNLQGFEFLERQETTNL